MPRYDMSHSEKDGTFSLCLYVTDEEVAGYISQYADTDGDAMGDEFADARSAVAFGAFNGLVEGDLHEELKYMCQEEGDWSD